MNFRVRCTRLGWGTRIEKSEKAKKEGKKEKRALVVDVDEDVDVDVGWMCACVLFKAYRI